MTQPRRGRTPRRPDPDASHAARLGAEIRALRQARGLTLQELATLIGFSPQHLSGVELATNPMSAPFVAACDDALDAKGALLALFPAVLRERAEQSHDRARARRTGIAAATGYRGTPDTRPAALVDPELVPHWLESQGILTDHDQLFGPHRVLSVAKRGVAIIGRHRQAARGLLRIDLMRVESRWEMFVAWLYDDTGNPRAATSMERARALAIEADDQLMNAYVLARQSERASRCGRSRDAIALAQAACRESRAPRGLAAATR